MAGMHMTAQHLFRHSYLPLYVVLVRRNPLIFQRHSLNSCLTFSHMDSKYVHPHTRTHARVNSFFWLWVCRYGDANLLKKFAKLFKIIILHYHHLLMFKTVRFLFGYWYSHRLHQPLRLKNEVNTEAAESVVILLTTWGSIGQSVLMSFGVKICSFTSEINRLTPQNKTTVGLSLFK